MARSPPAYRSSADAWVTEATPSDDAGLDTMQALLANERQAQRFANSGRGIALRFGSFYSPSNRATAMLLDFVRKRRLPLIGAAEYYVPSLHICVCPRSSVRSLWVTRALQNNGVVVTALSGCGGGDSAF